MTSMQPLSPDATGSAETLPASGASTRLNPLHVAYLVLTIALGVVFVSNLRWLNANAAPPIWDEARYLVNSLEAYDLITNPSLENLAELYYVRHEVRPSIGYVWLAVPIYALLGTDPDTVTLWANFILLGVLTFSTFGIGWRLFDIRIGLLAGVLVALNPEIVRLTRVYWPHLGVVAVAALGVYFLVLSDNLRRWKYVALLGILIGVGLMMRPIHPALILAGPVAFMFLYVFVEVFLARRRDREIDATERSQTAGFLQRVLAPAIIVVAPSLMLALPFYLRFGDQMVRYTARFQEAGTFAPVENVLSVESLLWYAANLPTSIGLPFGLLFFGGLVVYLGALFTRRVPGHTAILLAWLVVPYVGLSLQATKEFFYLAPLYPAVALLVAFGVLYLLRRSVTLQVAAGSAIAALSLLFLWQMSWGIPPANQLPGFLSIASRTPDASAWRSEEIIGAILQAAGADDSVTVGVVSALAHSSEPPLTYYARLAGSEMDIIRWTDPVPTLLDADYVVVKTGAVASPFPTTLKDTNATVVAQVLADESSIFYSTHVEIQRFDLPDGSQAVIYRRLAPASLDEAQTVAEALWATPIKGPALEQTRRDIAAAYLNRLFSLSTPLLAEERFQEALAILERAVGFDPRNPRANQDIARALLALGDCEGAIEHQRTAAQNLRTNGTYTVLGDLLLTCERVDDAIAAFGEAIEINPGVVRTHFALGRAYMLQGNVEAAIAKYRDVIEIDSSGDFAARARRLIDQLQSQ